MNKMYDLGFDDGVEYAINCCFGAKKAQPPYFETEEDCDEYWIGWTDGYRSIND